MLINPTPLVEKVLGLAIEVHKAVGPGLLESTYDSCLTYEFVTNGLAFKKQVPIPVVYKGVDLECGYRADMVVEGTLLLELKSIDRILPIHQAQVITYVRLLSLHQGILLNFNVSRLIDGVRNILV